MAIETPFGGQGASWFMAPIDGSGRVNTAGLTQLLAQVKQANCRCLILDLRAARVMQIYDVKLLLQTRDLLRGRHGRLRVVARAGGAVARLLKQHQLDPLFFLCESLEQAWATQSPTDSSEIRAL
jgi:anti-anti-sigma regulatory factor